MTDYRAIARQAAAAAGIDADLFERQIGAESGFNPNARSGAGAQGIAQIMPATAQGWGVNPMNPREALYESARRMRQYSDQYGGYRNALVAYNAGPGRVGKPLYSETENYINKIMGGSPSAQPSNSTSTGVPSSDRRTRLLESIFKGTPYEGLATQRAATQSTASAGEDEHGGGYVGGDVPSSGKDYRWLQQIGASKFGLKNDPGDAQTTGGKHTAGSLHYAGKAIDWGNSANTPAQLQKAYDYFNANRQKYGIKELIWQAPGHYDHLHIGLA